MKTLDAWKLGLSGTKLIEASAGTGKTHTLTTLYLRMLVEEDLRPRDILVVTYTNAAASELRERVRSRIREAIAVGEGRADGEVDPELRKFVERAKERFAEAGRVDSLRRALQEFDEAAIFTIHGFCQRTLQENAFESGVAFGAELVEKSDVLQRTLANDLWARLLSAEDPSFVEWLLTGAGSKMGFDPENLRRSVLEVLGADDEMPVLPDSHEAEVDVAALREAAESAWQAWAGAWRSRREVVSDLLLGKNDQSGNSYKPKTIGSKWIPQLDEWAAAIERSGPADAMNAVALPTWWANLTPTVLKEKTNKKGTTLVDEFFPFCATVMESVEALAAARRDRVLTLRRRFVDEAREEARKRREQRHLLFFDDLLTELRAALRPPEGNRLAELLRERYRFALIDEFQDTDPVQYEIFRRVWHDGASRDGAGGDGARGGLVLIGDPKQAIYSFRGADVFTYLLARDDAGGEVHGLDVNWRSNVGLISAVNALFDRPSRAFHLDSIQFDSVTPREGAEPAFSVPGRSGAGLRVLLADRKAIRAAMADGGDASEDDGGTKALDLRFGRTDFMRAMANDIAELLEARPKVGKRDLEPRDIAILCRRNSELARARRALEALGIPCVDRGDRDVFESREAWELSCVLRAMLRPTDPSSLRAALSTGAQGLGALEIEALGDEDPRLLEIGERFAEYARLWSRFGFGRAFSAWRRGEGVTERLVGYDDGERRLTNWLHLAELLQRVEEDRSSSRTGLVTWLENAIANPEARIEVGSDASLLRLERDDQAVSLITLHRSKGLEYEVVYLPCLWEAPASKGIAMKAAEDESKLTLPIRFFDEETRCRTLDLGSVLYPEHLGRAKEEELSEQLRVLYVGLTRARRQCVVLWGAIGSEYAKTPLAWLLHAPEWEGEGNDRSTSMQKLKEWTDDEWRRAWLSVGRPNGKDVCVDTICVETADLGTRGSWAAPRSDVVVLEPPPACRVLPRPVLTTSFSALTRDTMREGESLSGPIVLGRDLDLAVSHVPEASDASEGSQRSEGSTDAAEDAAPDLACDMHEFPRGAEAGTLLHDVLEQVDFSRLDARVVRELAEAAVLRNGMDPRHVEQIVHVVECVANTPLRTTPTPLKLSGVASGQQRPEIEFTLATHGRSEGEGFSPATLSALLASEPEGSPLHRYAGRLSRMSWRTLSGFLRGFIDSVFCDGERYYLIDYKSNHLGPRQADYMPERLVPPMIEHDYILQYLIYTLALDRHLATRLEGYDYERHFGGVFYLFLRGLAPTHTAGCGVFFDRPSEGVVRSAAALMGRARAEGDGG